MRYFANPAGPAAQEAMAAGLLGFIDTPRQRNIIPPDVIWCADNGVYGKGYPGDVKWWAWLQTRVADYGSDLCAFAVAPDVVGDAAATLKRSLPYLPLIRSLGIPAAYVAQDGQETVPVPWDEFDVLFLGGTDEFKLGPYVRTLVADAKSRGKLVHCGRVNSAKRFRYARHIGCDSADGTKLVFGPTVNLPQVLSWVREARDQASF